MLEEYDGSLVPDQGRLELQANGVCGPFLTQYTSRVFSEPSAHLLDIPARVNPALADTGADVDAKLGGNGNLMSHITRIGATCLVLLSLASGALSQGGDNDHQPLKLIDIEYALSDRLQMILALFSGTAQYPVFSEKVDMESAFRNEFVRKYVDFSDLDNPLEVMFQRANRLITKANRELENVKRAALSCNRETYQSALKRLIHANVDVKLHIENQIMEIDSAIEAVLEFSENTEPLALPGQLRDKAING